METLTEAQITIASKLYEARKAAKTLFQDSYPERTKDWGDLITKRMKKMGTDNAIEATLDILRLLDEKEGEDGFRTIIILASCVELIEPSK